MTRQEKAELEIKNATKEQELIRRMFTEIMNSYFLDRKLNTCYLQSGIKRSLGDDIGNYIQSKYPNWFYLKKLEHQKMEEEK